MKGLTNFVIFGILNRDLQIHRRLNLSRGKQNERLRDASAIRSPWVFKRPMPMYGHRAASRNGRFFSLALALYTVDMMLNRISV